MSITTSYSTSKINNEIDIDLFGIVGIRLKNATCKDVYALKKQLGVEPKKINFEPDITINYTPKLETYDFTYLGLNFAGFTKDSFFLLSGETSHKKIKIPFEKIGSKINIVCEQGIGPIPLLIHIINFTFLGKGYLPLHSSALYFDEKGLLVMGWTKGGKTETLMSFANHGASYVGDEWVILSPHGELMYGLPVPICIWEWQFPQIPNIMPKLNFKKKIVFGSVHFLDFIHRFFSRLGLGKITLAKLLEEALPVFKRQLNIRVLPKILFKDRTEDNGVPINFILLAISHDSEKIAVEKCESHEVIQRMINSNECEQLPFFEFYSVFKFAFPDKKNMFLENSKQLQYQLLSQALDKKRSYKVSHPYPVEFEKLYNNINQILLASE